MWKIISILPLIAFSFSISKDEASQPLRFDLVRFSTDGLGQTSWSRASKIRDVEDVDILRSPGLGRSLFKDFNSHSTKRKDGFPRPRRHYDD